MPKRLTMGTLVTRCKQRADMENDDHIAGAEWKSLISEAYGEAWMIAAGTGYRYFETSETITADGSTSYDEPESHLSTVLITRVDSSGREFALDEIMQQEEPCARGSTGDAQYWTLVDSSLYLFPVPSSGTYKWYYRQQPTDISAYADIDVVDVITTDGLAFVLWCVAVKALSKSEADVRLAIAERDRHAARLLEWAAERAVESRRIIVNHDLPSLGDPAEYRYR